jgi:hypothetical protein
MQLLTAAPPDTDDHADFNIVEPLALLVHKRPDTRHGPRTATTSNTAT